MIFFYLCSHFLLSFMLMNEKSDIYRIKKDDREFILVGTAHISQASKGDNRS